MNGSSRSSLSLTLVGVMTVCAVTVPASRGRAEPERARTLTFDKERKVFVEVPPPPAGTAEGDLHALRLLLDDEQYGAAFRATRTFVKQYGETHALYPDILIARAEAQIGRRDYYKAYKTLQEFLNRFGGFELVEEALRLQFVIAETYLGGTKRKVWGMRIFSGEDVALRILDDIAAGYPDSEYAPLALKIKADYHFRTGEFSLAELDYARLLRNYPNSRYHQFALRRTAEAALSSFGGIAYDDSALIEAEERYHDYRLRYPRVSQTEDVEVILTGISEQRAAKELATGQYYERTQHLGTAIFYYRSVLKHWPNTVAACEAQSRLELLRADEPPVTTIPAEAVPEGADG